jgi:hypothetical protein
MNRVLVPWYALDSTRLRFINTSGVDAGISTLRTRRFKSTQDLSIETPMSTQYPN